VAVAVREGLAAVGEIPAGKKKRKRKKNSVREGQEPRQNRRGKKRRNQTWFVPSNKRGNRLSVWNTAKPKKRMRG
jgi:hypothetical protein